MNILKSCRLIIQSFQRVTKRYLFQVILSHQCLPNQLRRKRKPLLFPAFLMGSQQTFIVNDTKDEQIYNLNAEVKALKSFIVEQLYVIKKSIEDIKCQESIPNSLDLLQSLKKELSYFRNENLIKTSIIKSLTENLYVPANINSAVFPPNLHHEKVQHEKHKSTANKLHGLPKTDGKSIINLHETKSKGNKKVYQDLRPNIPQRKKHFC